MNKGGTRNFLMSGLAKVVNLKFNDNIFWYLHFLQFFLKYHTLNHINYANCKHKKKKKKN